MAWQRVRIPVPEDLNKNEREEAGRLMIEGIRDRTAQGMGIRQSGDRVRLKAFAEYSPEYLDKKKKAGKYSGAVDLKWTGDMMKALDVISHQKGSILIGFENGSEENDKAEWNREGTSTPNRDFLGMTKAEIRAVVKTVKQSSS